MSSKPEDGATALELRDALVRLGMIGPAADLDDPESTRRRVLEAAITLFADRGFDACTMRELAREVGVKAPAIYNYYDSKESILAAASRDALRRFLTVVVGPLPGDPPGERFKRMVRRWVIFQVEERDVARANAVMMDTGALKRLLPKREWEVIAETHRLLAALIGSLIDPPVTGLREQLVVRAIGSVCDRSWRSERPDRDGLPKEAVADQVWEICCRIVSEDAPASVA